MGTGLADGCRCWYGGWTASLRLSPATILVRLNSFSDFARRKAGFVFQLYVGWQSPCVLSEA